MNSHQSLRIAVCLFTVFVTNFSSLRALDLNFDVNFPEFSGFDVTIMVNDEPCNIVVRIAPDAKGKYACTEGGCTVNGVPVVAKAAVKPVATGGGIDYAFKASLKSEKGAAEKVSLKITGLVIAGIADFRYKGPKGKAAIVGQALDILGDLGLKIGTVSIDPQLLDPTKPGKLGGNGSLNVGIGNDTADEGPLKVKISPTSISLSLKVGKKKKMSFKGRLEDGTWVGSLTVQAKPFAAKKVPFNIPAEGILAALPPKVKGGGKCGEDIDIARTGNIIHTLDMVNSGQFFGGTAEIFLSPAGNIAIVHSFPSSMNSHWYAEKNCQTFNPAPQEVGKWFDLDVGSFEFDTGRTLDRGRVTFTLNYVGADLRGTWQITGGDSGATGTFISYEPACGAQTGEDVGLFFDLRTTTPALVGDFITGRTAIGTTVVTAFLSGVPNRSLIVGYCTDQPPVPTATGEWISAPVWDQTFTLPTPVPAGTLAIQVDAVQPPSGTWSYVDENEVQVYAGSWPSP